ncbi:MAG: hypothetical protein JW881_15385 [Spirochaetales bacterium]|nr:hypothetical protein [Spirochaetales bacterium]
MRQSKTLIAFFIGILIFPSLFAMPQSEASGSEKNGGGLRAVYGQRELGPVILFNLTVEDGMLRFIAASGGCTTKADFRVNVHREAGVSEKVPHYGLSIERVVPDECKGFFPEGAVIEFDLEKDLGLKGTYTVSIANPVFPRAAGFFEGGG